MPLLMNINLYSQTKALTSNGDTVICFSVQKAKFLLKQHYKVKELMELDSINKAQLALKDSVNATNKRTISDLDTVVANQKKIIDFRGAQLSDTKDKLAKSQKQAKISHMALKAVSGVAIVELVIIAIKTAFF